MSAIPAAVNPEQALRYIYNKYKQKVVDRASEIAERWAAGVANADVYWERGIQILLGVSPDPNVKARYKEAVTSAVAKEKYKSKISDASVAVKWLKNYYKGLTGRDLQIVTGEAKEVPKGTNVLYLF